MWVRGAYLVFTFACFSIIVVTNLALHRYFRHNNFVYSKTPANAEFHTPKLNSSLVIHKRCRVDNVANCLRNVKSYSWVDIKIPVENAHVSAREGQSDGSDSRRALDSSNVVEFDSPKFSQPTPKGFVEINKTNSKKSKRRKFPLTFPSVESSHSPRRLQERIKTFPQDSEIVKFLKTQDDRLVFEKKYCSRKTNSTSLSRLRPKTFQSIIIDREYSITFCPVYKAASSSWLVNLLTMKGAWNDDMKGKLQKQVNRVFHRISTLMAPWTSRGTTKFMIVRHPLHRLLSCYRDKFEGASKFYYYERYGEKMMRMFRPSVKGMRTNEASLLMTAVKKKLKSEAADGSFSLEANPFADPIGPTFEEFAKYVVFYSRDDEHWRPFYLHCSLCHITYDFILRFENLYSDSKLYVEYLNMTNVIKTGWENPSSDGTTTDAVVCNYLNQINSDLLEKIISKYKVDFELFHYDSNGYEKCVKDYKSL